MRPLIKPSRLAVGDCLAIVSPASPALSCFTTRAERARNALNAQGLSTVLAPNALKATGVTAGSPTDRAADIHWAFQNRAVAGILCALGGMNCNEILPHLDFDLIYRHPKLFIGYSDITALLIAIHCRTGMVTFHGPALLSEWGEYPQPFEETVASFLTVCFGTSAFWELALPTHWTDEFLEWADSDHRRARLLKKNHAWKWVMPGRGSGRLFGGNIDTLNMLCGTDYLKVPDTETILFFEATTLSLPGFRRALEHLVQVGLFETAKGLLFAKYHRCDKAAGGTPSSSAEVDFEGYEEVLAEKIGRFGIPIASRLDIGHTDPMFTIPIGIPALMDSSNNRVTILDRAVSN